MVYVRPVSYTHLRFAEILVERGWTSSKDLVGYYNPLTKEIESTQPRFSECMKKDVYKRQLQKLGYLTVAGRVNTNYFRKKVCYSEM